MENKNSLDILYNGILDNIKKNGSIIDPYLNSPLNFQYHYSSFIFSSYLRKNKVYKKVLRYFDNIPINKTDISLEFNNFFFLLSQLFYQSKCINNENINFIKNYRERSDSELNKLNNNFKCLSILNQLLHKKLIGKNKNIETNYFSKIQDLDGLFIDTDSVNESLGIPHLTYHSKILMCSGLSFLVSKEKEFKKNFNLGYKALMKLSSSHINSFYGRSINSSFGYSNTLMCHFINYYLNGDLQSFKLYKKIRNILLKNLNNKNTLNINLNSINPISRPGYDRYMFNIVYSSYSLALFDLIDNFNLLFKLNDKVSSVDNSIRLKNYYLKQSGFVIYNSKKYSICFNLKGHYSHPKYFLDTRLAPISFCYLNKNSNNLIPSMYFPYQSITRDVEKKFIYRKLLSLIKKFNDYSLPSKSGFTVYLKYNFSSIFIYKRISINDYTNKYSTINFNPFYQKKSKIICNYIYKFNKNNFKQKFNFENHPVNCDLIYTVRSKSKGTKLNLYKLIFDSFSIIFDKKIDNLVSKKVSFSDSEGYFYKVCFKNCSNLKIKIKCLEEFH